MKYNYPEHRTKDIHSAIKLANWLKSSGKYDFFRGQRHTFDIQPSIFRNGVDRQECAKKLNQFAHWVHQTPELNSLHNNPDAILAVAQHYGIKTNLIDFSYSPEIAGFFATDGANKGDIGTIICINKRNFENSWRDINKRVYAGKGFNLAELVEIEVKNLWRLQAQQGLFLKCQTDYQMLEMFSCFLHIYFPQDGKTKLLEQEVVYPKLKSHLEVLLDQYFLIDSYPEREKELQNLFGKPIISITNDVVLKEMKTYFINEQLPPVHTSWNSEMKQKWLAEPQEKLNNQGSNLNFTLIISTIKDISEFQNDIETQLRTLFTSNNINKKSVNWSVMSERRLPLYFDSEGSFVEEFNEWTEFTVAEMVNSIYSGMRTLPYTEENIITSIARYITLGRFGIYESMNNIEGIEFEGAGFRGRGFCSSQKLKECIRDDFYKFIKPNKLDKNGQLDMRDIIFLARHIKHSYNFIKLKDLFIQDIIPTQALVANEKLVIHLNPMKIEILGES